MRNYLKISDYRCAVIQKYTNIKELKDNLRSKIEDRHRTNNHYSLIRPNDGKYKDLFMKCYDDKCAYCGIPLGIIKKDEFEIDHFLPKSNKDNDVDMISNLVLACKNCNRNKKDFVPIEDDLHPDNLKLQNVFKRNADFEIVISDEYKDKKSVQDFYDKLKFDSVIHRIDFVLIYIKELIYEKSKNHSMFDDDVLIKLKAIYGELLDKRNCIR